jgi:hypothetical protein
VVSRRELGIDLPSLAPASRMVPMDDADRRIEEQPYLGFMQAATKIVVLATGRGSQSAKLLVKTSYEAHSFGRYAHQCTDEMPNPDQIAVRTQNSPPIFSSVPFKSDFGMSFRENEPRYGATTLGLKMRSQPRDRIAREHDIVVYKQNEFPGSLCNPHVFGSGKIGFRETQVSHLLLVLVEKSSDFFAVAWGLIDDNQLHLSRILLGENTRYRRAKGLIPIVGGDYY